MSISPGSSVIPGGRDTLRAPAGAAAEPCVPTETMRPSVITTCGRAT